MTSRAWFGHKRFGAGFNPSTWEGWLALLVFVVVVPGGLTFILDHGAVLPAPGLLATAWVIAATAAFLTLVWIKRDRSKPVKFRWGSQD
jgi:hypothetical protein